MMTACMFSAGCDGSKCKHPEVKDCDRRTRAADMARRNARLDALAQVRAACNERPVNPWATSPWARFIQERI